ncbi:glutathione-dependent formaldehyde-activating enzyme [Diaporthe helianthi]|uniref:Glutathione-dependent formaldehyde-activating enzyme n=1 Tax=Diaporthe helianthi TaxID=158607 RepID=A0A2P5HQA3_DIAHE|nr:glutathione-dependent formaldehyde-activating enzyme [Diaporthe helianthi]
MAEIEVSTRKLTASCYCQAVRYSIEIPRAKLPLGVYLCHCSICRYTHGTLCIFHAELPSGIVPKFIAPSSRASLTGYKHAHAQAERFFCSTCGSHVVDEDVEVAEGEADKKWRVSTSLFLEQGEDLFQVRTHCFTDGSTGGSGLFSLLPKMGDHEMKTFNPGSDSGGWSAGMQDEVPKQAFDSEGNEVLRAGCHCGGVSFTIPRPTLPAVTNDPFISRYVSPTEKGKWKAFLDVCDDCRRIAGVHVVAWIPVPRLLIQPQMPLGLAPYGTMKTYESSEGTLRGFCGDCGAIVTASWGSRTPTPEQQIISVPVGILRAPEGVLAENWVTWRGCLANFNSGHRFDPVFAESLLKGLEQWSTRQYGEAVIYSID